MLDALSPQRRRLVLGVAVVVGVLVGGLLGWLTLIWVLTWLAEARACRRAAASWRYETASGAVAVGLRTVDQQTGGWLLQSMAARPRGSGAGSELMRLVCAQADDAGATIALVAVTGRVADWYLQFGFRRVSSRRMVGHGPFIARTPPIQNQGDDDHQSFRLGRFLRHLSSPLTKSAAVLGATRCWVTKLLSAAVCCATHEAAAFYQRAASCHSRAVQEDEHVRLFPWRAALDPRADRGQNRLSGR